MSLLNLYLYCSYHPYSFKHLDENQVLVCAQVHMPVFIGAYHSATQPAHCSWCYWSLTSSVDLYVFQFKWYMHALTIHMCLFAVLPFRSLPEHRQLSSYQLSTLSLYIFLECIHLEDVNYLSQNMVTKFNVSHVIILKSCLQISNVLLNCST